MGDCIIVVPCYNEAERLDVAAFLRFAAEGHRQRFLMINDGSRPQAVTTPTPQHATTPDECPRRAA